MFALMRALTYSAIFIGFVLVFLPGRVLQWAGVTRPSVIGAAQITGAAIVVLGGILVVACVVSFALIGKGTPAPYDPPRRLVVRGPYRWVRNPMYWGAALALGGAALFYQSVALFAYALLFLVVMHALVLGYEEPTLRGSFGSEYEEYCRRVSRWLPFAPRRRKTNA